MAVPKLQYAIGNSASTTLSVAAANSDTSMTITSDTNFAAKSGEGMVIIDEAQATEEIAYSSSKSGAVLSIPLVNRGLEGGSAQGHAINATVKGILSAGMWNDMITSLLNFLDQTTGAVDTTKILTLTGTQTTTNKTLTSPVINTGISGTAITDEDDMVSDSATKVPTEQSVKAHVAAGTVTMTNKRITKRVLSAASYTTDTGTSLNCDNYDTFIVTAQAGDLLFNNPSGTPTDGQTLWIAVTGTAARALTYGNGYESSAGATLPTTTVTTARIDIALVWVAATSKWRCVGAA
jgi:hypothetical protein